MTDDFTYAEMESLLSRADCPYSAAEIHGVACGLLAVNVNANDELWLKQIFVRRDEHDVLQNETAPKFKKVMHTLRGQIQDEALNFTLLLPEDEEVLEARLEAMQEWTQGFLLGIALAGVQEFSSLPEDSRELLEDFVEIGKSGEVDLENEEESEEAFQEIVEYLRMGTLLMIEELQPSRSAITLH